jgi:hypothetical protein
LLCTDDKEASSLLAFFRHNVDFITADGKILNPVQTVLFASPSAQNDSYMLNGKVRVFPSTAAERRRSGLAYHAEWEYHSGRKILTIPSRVGREYTRVWAGALFFHELRHAYDQVTGIEKKSTSGSVEFLMGELRAYTLEINLLDRETAGAFSRKTAEIASSHDKQGWIMIDFAMSRRLDQVFAPAKSENERIMRDGLFFVALNFQVSNNKKLGEKGKIDFLRSIYNTHEHRQ